MTLLERPDLSPMDPADAVLQSRYRGCLLGGAVGNALGAAVEFMDEPHILQTFGPNGIRDYAPAYGGLGRITDDTQMTLFTADGMMRAHVRGQRHGVAPPYASVTALAYQRWLMTQEHAQRARTDEDGDPGWLLTHPELFSRRAPGNTCQSALQVRKAAGKLADNDSKGCGGVMRVAPAGMYFAGLPSTAVRPSRGDDIRQPFEVAATLAGLTHGHPTGQLTAGVLAAAIALLLGGTKLPQAVQAAIKELQTHPNHEETSQAMVRACRLAASRPSDSRALKTLGEGWVAEEALAMSVYCALGAKDFLGAAMGVEAIPGPWLQPLELREAMVEMADDLRTVHRWKLDPGGFGAEEAYWSSRYPGH